MDELKKARPSKLGYASLLSVVAGFVVMHAWQACFGLLILGYGEFTALALIIFDARDARPFSRPAVVALLLGPALLLLTSGASP